MLTELCVTSQLLFFQYGMSDTGSQVNILTQNRRLSDIESELDIKI